MFQFSGDKDKIMDKYQQAQDVIAGVSEISGMLAEPLNNEIYDDDEIQRELDLLGSQAVQEKLDTVQVSGKKLSKEEQEVEDELNRIAAESKAQVDELEKQLA